MKFHKWERPRLRKEIPACIQPAAVRTAEAKIISPSITKVEDFSLTTFHWSRENEMRPNTADITCMHLRNYEKREGNETVREAQAMMESVHTAPAERDISKNAAALTSDFPTSME